MTVEAMKPAVRKTLELIACGSIVIEIDFRAHVGYLDTVAGQRVRDPEFPERKLLVPGVWWLYERGYLDRFGLVTAAGQQVLRA